MATSKEIVSGVGARMGRVYVLDTNTGLPLPSSTSATPYTGFQMEGIKEYSVDAAAPRRIDHFGDDRPYAQDSLPADTISSMTVVTSKDNMTLDEALTGNAVYSPTGLKIQAEDTDNKGNEVQVAAFFYRQALDTTKGSATFGSLRQYNGKWVGSCRMVPQIVGASNETVDQTYDVTLTPVTRTPWGQRVTAGSFGATEATAFKQNSNQHPYPQFYRGNGTLGAFNLSYAPADSTALTVWVAGTEVTPGSITYGASPAFSLSAVPADGSLVAAIVQTSTQP